MVMQLKLNPRQKCYTKLLSNIKSTGVAQTTSMTKLLQKLLMEQLSANAAQTTSKAEMVNKIYLSYTTLVYIQDIHKIA